MLFCLALPGKAMAVTGSISSCSACHNYPPDDAATRDSGTGAFSGNHGTHFSANNCHACHNSVGASMYRHSMNSAVASVNYINMTGVIHNSRMGAAAKYNKGIKFAQSSTPTLSNCSNVNCHFETATPTWGQSLPWSSTKTAGNNDANCSQCHAATGLSSGTHVKHITAGGGTQTACAKCHPDYNSLAGTAAFQHASSGNHPITLTFAAAPNLGGAYAGGRAGNNFLPSAAQSATGSCSALYCHSPGNKTSSYDPPNTTPVTWGGSLSCKGCHKADFTSGDTMLSGSHERHVGSAGVPWYKIDCVRCHAATVNAGLSIKNVAKHVNAGVDLAFDSSSSAVNGTYKGSAVPLAITPGTLPYGGCSNVYCHSNGQNDTGIGITYKNPVWGTSSTGRCGTCHDVDAGFGHGTVQIASGKHSRHLAYGYGMSSAGDRCTICHDVGNNFSNTGCSGSCHGGTSKHANNQVDVIIPSYFGASASYSGTPKPGDGYGSCSSVYCHSDGQATPAYAPAISWTVVGPLSCTACHGGAVVNSPGGTALSGKHAAHVNPAVNTELGTGNGFGCIECHQKTVASNTALNATTGTTAHVNKFLDYTGLRAGGPARYNSTTKQCSNFYCHSNAKPGTAVAEFKNPPAWNSVSSLGCNGCHGNNTVLPDAANPTNANLGQPNYTNGGAGTASANSHKRHVIDAGLSNTTGCYNCHSKTVDKYTASRFRPYSTTHASGGINIIFSPIVGGTYTSGVGNKTCATTACHGAGTPQWGGASLACNACHSANNSGYWATNSSHRQHWEDAAVLPTSYTAVPGNSGNATTYMFQCSSCHASTAAHANLTNAASAFGSAEIFFGYTSSNRKGTYNYAGSTTGTEGTIKWTAGGNCSTTYCHSNGNGGNPVNTAFTWASPNGTIDCGGCHDKAGDAGWSGSATHLKHVTGYVANTSITCNACHALTASSNSAISDKTKHVNKTKDVSFNAFANSAATHNLTNSQCQNVYCHGNGTTATPTVTVTWSGTLGCTGCHPTAALSTGSHTKHLAASATCNNCHNVTAASSIALNATTGTANHVNKNVTINLDGASATAAAQYNGTNAGGANIYQKAVASATGACSNIYCHSNGTGIWAGTAGTGSTPDWGTAGGCSICHGNATYTNYRKAGPTYASASPKPNAHPEHIDVTDATADGTAGTGTQCKHCHYTITTNNTTINGTAAASHNAGSYTVGASGASATYKDGDNVGGANVNVTATYTYNGTPNSSTCSNVSCHPTGLAGSKAASTTTWDKKYKCTDCHKVDMNNNTGYHHAMRNFSGSVAAYPKTIPGATAGANDISRRCTMCHVDHNTFSPNLNSSNTTYGSAGNLRMSILSSVTVSKGYTNRDFFKTGSGGICISCHNAELYKDTGNVRVKNETSSTKTPAIVLNNYTGSAHEYAINSIMKRDSKIFYSDCTKCHNSRKGEVAQFSSMTTATHDSGATRIYASLGTDPTTGIDALFCYRCHSNAADAIGGTKKPVDGKDYYNVASMNAASEDIWTVTNNVGTTYTTTASSTLYLRNSNTINVVPPATEPSAYQYSSGTYTTNTFTGNQEDMAPAVGATGTTTVISTGATAARYNRGIQFVSPQIDNTVTIASGSTFTLTLNEVRVAGTSTDYTRFTVYKWDGTTATPLNTTAAPNNYAQNATAIPTTAANRVTTFTTNSAVTLNPGEALICDVEFYHSAGTTALNVTYSYGNNSGTLALPAGTYNWRTAATTKAGHSVTNAAYAGKHRPSPTDETLAYIASNKHVSCNDCHNPHEARSGNHTVDASNRVVMAKVLKGATGVAVTWNATNWTAPTYTGSTAALPTATAEYQICFKCHSGANTSYASWGGSGAAAWTDIGLEFSPKNESSHPVVVSTNDASRTNAGAPKALTAARMVAPWNVNVGTQTMTCSDCHATDSTASKGPHGSGVKWMLAGTNKAWPYTTTAGNGGSSGTLWTYNNQASGTANGVFCLNCHVIANSPHTATTDHQGTACVNCHLRVPHGGKVSRLIATRNGNPGTTLPARYHPNGNGGGGTVYITSFIKAASYGTGNCAVTGCSSHGAITGESW